MSSYRKLELKQFPKNELRLTGEGRFWNKFKNPQVSKHYNQITDINFCPTKPHDYAVTTSTRVLVCESKTCSVKKTITRFKDVAYSGSFRNDGKLVVGGCEDGVVRVFDVNSRIVLRQFTGHSQAVHVTRFLSDNTSVVSCSDDKTVRRWDVPSQQEIGCWQGHTDHVRCGVAGKNKDSYSFISGSYDHTVKIWDARSNQCVMTMDHGFPVEAVLPLPGGSLIVSAGDNKIVIWDLLSGGRSVHSFSNHQKAITSLCLDSSSSRLISASLDQSVKFFNLDTYEVIHSIKYSSPILSMAMSPDNTVLAVGMADGTLDVRKRDVQTVTDMKSKPEAKPGTSRYINRGQNYKPDADSVDFKLEKVRTQKLQPYDKMLKKFRYRDALDTALEVKKAVCFFGFFPLLSVPFFVFVFWRGGDDDS